LNISVVEGTQSKHIDLAFEGNGYKFESCLCVIVVRDLEFLVEVQI